MTIHVQSNMCIQWIVYVVSMPCTMYKYTVYCKSGTGNEVEANLEYRLHGFTYSLDLLIHWIYSFSAELHGQDLQHGYKV